VNFIFICLDGPERRPRRYAEVKIDPTGTRTPIRRSSSPQVLAIIKFLFKIIFCKRGCILYCLTLGPFRGIMAAGKYVLCNKQLKAVKLWEGRGGEGLSILVFAALLLACGGKKVSTNCELIVTRPACYQQGRTV
jgi:hypothetical protein